MPREETENSKSTGFVGWIIKLIGTSIVLAIVSFFTPGFSIRGMWSFLLAALVISLLDYLAERMMRVDASPFGKGIKGFFIAAIILYLAQFVVPHMNVSIIGALIGAVVIGIIDAIIPGRIM